MLIISGLPVIRAHRDASDIAPPNFPESDFGTASKAKSSFSLPILGLPYRPGFTVCLLNEK
jgi:hypothetical protein